MSPKRPEHILLATDLGPASEAAVRFAGMLAGVTGAKLTIFHSIAPLLFFDFGGWDPHSFRLAAENQTSQALDEIRRLCSTELAEVVPVSAEVRECYPVQGILQFVQHAGCDLIVLGTHAWGPVASLLLGSVTQGVLHGSDVPVITVRPGSDGAGELRTILCPIDSSPAAHAAAAHASMIAETTGAALQFFPLDDPDPAAESLFEWQPGSISLRPDRPIPRRLHSDEEVIRHVKDHQIDLIVLGTRHKRFRDTTILGTTTERIIRDAPCAVMAVTANAGAERHIRSGAA